MSVVVLRQRTGPKLLTHCKRGHDLFVYRKRTAGGRAYCRACDIEKAKERYNGDVEFRSKNSAYRKVQFRKWKYGVNAEQFQEMFASQKGACAVCENLFLGTKICVDHDHDTGAVRGLLCHNCNIGLGNFKDREDVLQKAISYLEAHRVL